MFIANLKVSLRHFVRQRLYSVINVLGLSIGLACCLYIALYAVDEASYDKQHPDAERIYRFSRSYVALADPLYMADNAPQVGPLLKDAFTEVEDFTRLLATQQVLSTDTQRVFEEPLYMADPSVFNFFSFKWLAGNPNVALAEPLAIVLTQSVADKYFDGGPALGRVVQLGTGKKLPLRVTGVIADLPHNTHLVASGFVSLSTTRLFKDAIFEESWSNNNFLTYLKLKSGVDYASLEPALAAYATSNMPNDNRVGWQFSGLNVRDIHLHSPLEGPGMRSSGNFENLLTLVVIGAALLILAAINFVNLATAGAMRRGKEIQLRKAIGSSRCQLFLQFMGETSMLVLLALLIALVLTEMWLPLLNTFTGKHMTLATLFSSLPLLCGIGGAVFALTLLAGAYPALYSSGWPSPIGRRTISITLKRFSFGNMLVVCQFAVAITLVVATVVVNQQVQYGKRVSLGFNKNQLLVLEGPIEGIEDWPVLKSELLKQAGIESATLASVRPFSNFVSVWDIRHEGGDSLKTLTQLRTDADYFSTYQVPLLAGRYFSEAALLDNLVMPTEETPVGSGSYILNRSALAVLGWTPDGALGKWLELDQASNFGHSIRGTVVGVVDDMRLGSLHETIKPAFYLLSTDRASSITLRLAGGDVGNTMERIESVWSAFYPDRPIKATFVDATFDGLYEREERFVQLLGTFSLLAVLISCLGLFGLTASSVERRTREIGIRKVMGGSAWSIVFLLSNGFSRLVLISNLIAWPIAYYAMARWLETFAYRIDLTPLVFVGSGLIALCIAWVTVGVTAAKAASQKPVLALRYE